MVKEKFAYLKGDRLSDVMALICFLATEKTSAFWKDDSIKKGLNGQPNSAQSWFDIAFQHPEFFKFNQEGISIVLLLRSLNPSIDNKGDYLPLKPEETLKLVDFAIALHDKQLSRYQRNGFKIPIWAAIIAAIVTLITTTFTWFSNKSSNDDFEKKLEYIINKVDSIQSMTRVDSHKSIRLDTTRVSK